MARCIAGEHFDSMKYHVVHGTEHLLCMSVHIILVVAQTIGFLVWVADVKLAYVKSDKPLIKKLLVMNPES